jgi:hypothetical protein
MLAKMPPPIPPEFEFEAALESTNKCCAKSRKEESMDVHCPSLC